MDATAWIAAASAVVALAALYFTWQQAKNAQRQTDLQHRIHEDSAQPYVWADLRPSDQDGFLMLLVIHNEGPTTATGVRVKFDPPMSTRWDAEREEERAVYELASMPPGRRLSWHVGTGAAWFESKGAKRFSVAVDCSGPFGQVPTLNYDLDFLDFANTAMQPSGTLHGVTKAVKDLTKEVKNGPQRSNQPRS